MNDLLWQIAKDKQTEVCQAIAQRPLPEASDESAKSSTRWWVVVVLAAGALVTIHALIG